MILLGQKKITKLKSKEKKEFLNISFMRKSIKKTSHLSTLFLPMMLKFGNSENNFRMGTLYGM
jgi:hypothetical protein